MSKLEKFGSKEHHAETKEPKLERKIFCYYCAHCGRPNTGQCCTYPLDTDIPVYEDDFAEYMKSCCQEIQTSETKINLDK